MSGAHSHSPAANHTHGQRHFWIGLIITLGFAGIEALAGMFAHSLALLGDAGHMATDSLALGLAGFAAWIAERPASQRHSYGLGRMEVMAALVNTLLMLGIVAGIVIKAVGRFRQPPQVQASVVMLVGAAGIVVNLAIYWALQHGDDSLNVRASLLHVLGDMLGSGAALLSGVVIALSGWLPIDPLLSLFIGTLILVSSLKLLGDASHVLLEGVPQGMDLGAIGRDMCRVEGVRSIHDLHIWSVSSGEVALSAHVVIENMGGWDPVYQGLKDHLHASYGIEHITLQPEPQVLARVPVSSISRH